MSLENQNNNLEASTLNNSVVLNGKRVGILGVKAGMTQVYTQDGAVVPVTVIDLQPNVVTQVKTKDRDGYTAVQVGMLPKKPQATNKPEKGHFKASGFPGFKFVKEFRVDSVDGLTAGALISIDFLKPGDLVDITGISKGKGYQGTMKRYNFGGMPRSHGMSVSHRSLGSIGNRADPAKVFPGKKMPGHMGAEQVTVQNLEVMAIDKENNLMLIKGSVPGYKNGTIVIRKAVKDVK
jgi:large subunit ribosomal protein L3